MGYPNRDKSIMQKLDKLLQTVGGIDERVREQDIRLQRQEERVSIANVSALPSASSSPKHEAQKKLPSFQDIRSDSRVQAEVDKCLQQYQNLSRVETGRQAILKSG